MSDENKDETTATPEDDDRKEDAAPEQNAQDSTRNGPNFTKAPGDPFAGVKKAASNVMASMEGKTVSMRLYVGTVIGVVVLMLLARCGG